MLLSAVRLPQPINSGRLGLQLPREYVLRFTALFCPLFPDVAGNKITEVFIFELIDVAWHDQGFAWH